MSQLIPNCRHCGKPLKRPKANFCTHCGAPIKATETVHGGSLAKIIIHLPGQETQEEFLSKPVTTLGRRRSNMIQVLSPIVSGHHARIDLTSQGHTITDLQSTNGTYLNGKLLKPHQPHLLASQDLIRFSDSLGNSAKLTYIAPSGFGEVSQLNFTRAFQLTTPISFIGRNPQAAISLDHPAVSWNHARVVRRDTDRYIIHDLSSNNGTFVNGLQLRQARSLARGDVIQIGPFNLVYQGQGRFVTFSAQRNFRLEVVDLEKRFYQTSFLGLENQAQPRIVLRNLNLVINPREFVALVGSSGTGKSTLMRALSGISPPTKGTVLVNGDNMYHNFNLYRTMLGYVPQDDIIHEGLEVWSVLYYAACLRLPDATPSEMTDRINEVLEKVSMMAEAHSMVRNLSGGQRKRVSIAVELLAEPWIFFLDEPTSGLDPGLEKLMMDTLRQLADEGRTIVLVTHATSNIVDNCDHVAFLAPGGELTYFGPPEQATEFFKVNNFPDIYTLLAQTYGPTNESTIPKEIRAEYDYYVQAHQPPEPILAGSLWAERFRHSMVYETYIVNRQTGEVARPITTATTLTVSGLKQQVSQFKVLGQRYLNLIIHDKISLGVLLLVMPLIGLFLLLISNQAALVGHNPAEIATILETEGSYSIVTEAQTLLFMMALAANMLGVFAASFEIIKEKAIYHRERMINLTIPPYFASKFVVLGLFSLLQCFLLLTFLALKVNFPATGAIFWSAGEYYFTLVMTALASIALGLFISTLATSRNTVIYLILIVLFMQIAFSGAIFELTRLTEPLSYLTITRWSLEALGNSTDMASLNELGQVRVTREVDLAGRGIQTVIEDVQTTVDFNLNYNYSAGALLLRWLGLGGHTVVWSGLAMWWLKRQD